MRTQNRNSNHPLSGYDSRYHFDNKHLLNYSIVVTIMSTITIDDFPGDGKSHRLAFPQWQTGLFGVASTIGPRTYGMLGFLLAPADWLALPGNNGPFVPLQDPGARPAQAAALSAWKVDHEAFADEQANIQTLKRAYLLSLDTEATAVVSEPQWGTIRRTLADMHARLVAAYAVLSAGDIEELEQNLLVPFQPTTQSVRDYIQAHTDAAAALDAAGSALSAQKRFQLLRKGTRDVPPFDKTVAHYVEQNQAVAAQTFDGLAAALRAKADNTLTTATTGSAGYAGAATPLREEDLDTDMALAAAGLGTITLTREDLRQLIADAIEQSRQADRSARQADRSSGRNKQPTHWCWTHGDNFTHQSDKCIHPGQGHRKQATKQNKLGSKC